MQALGLIETKGLIPAIVSTDVMLKSANVNLLEKTYVGGGLVTILIVGDVGAVKSAIEAGSAEVKRINEDLLISEHVIPRPHDELSETIINGEILIDKQKKIETSIEEYKVVEEVKTLEIEEDKILEEVKEETEEVKEETKTLEAKVESNLEKNGEEVVNLESEDIQNKDERTLKNKADLDSLIAEFGVEKASEYFLNLRVKELREIVRKYTNFPMKSKEISKANKKEIVEALKKYYLAN